MGGLMFVAGMIFLFCLALAIVWFDEHIYVVYNNYFQKNGKCIQVLPCIEVYYGYERGSDTPNGLLIGWLYWAIEFRYND